jgi:hypothetical protein
MLVLEISNLFASFRVDIGLFCCNRCFTLIIIPFVRAIRGRPGEFQSSIKAVSRTILHHCFIVRRHTAPFRSQKIFVGPSSFSYFEETSFWISLHSMINEENREREREILQEHSVLGYFPSFIDKDHWPPNSPDLNPLDYSIWDKFVHAIDWEKVTFKKTLIEEKSCLKVVHLGHLDCIVCQKITITTFVNKNMLSCTVSHDESFKRRIDPKL